MLIGLSYVPHGWIGGQLSEQPWWLLQELTLSSIVKRESSEMDFGVRRRSADSLLSSLYAIWNDLIACQASDIGRMGGVGGPSEARSACGNIGMLEACMVLEGAFE